MPRRKFLGLSAATMGALGALGAAPAEESGHGADQHRSGPRPARASSRHGRRAYNSEYAGEYLNRVAFPLGGIGAGMICLEGTGALSHVSLRNHPDVFNEPCVFAAISVKGKRPAARVLEGPVPGRKLFGAAGTGNGAGGTTYGLPRFANATFRTHFPFGVVTLADPQVPLSVEITGWSPFEPGDADNSSLPAAALEYRFTNRSKGPVEVVFSFNARGKGSNRRLDSMRSCRNRSTVWLTPGLADPCYGVAGARRTWRDNSPGVPPTSCPQATIPNVPTPPKRQPLLGQIYGFLPAFGDWAFPRDCLS